jgi:hypothetical protein
MSVRTLSLAAALVAGAAVFVACSSDTSVSATATGAGGGSTAASTSESASASESSSAASTGSSSSASASSGGCTGLGDACSDCAFESCGAEYCACFADPACANLIVCAQACGPMDAECAQGCLTANEDGIATAALIGDCSAASCPADCPASPELTACEVCLFTSCAAEMNACLANPDCNLLAQCAQGCGGDAACAAACYFQYPDGQADATAVQECGAACPECG